MSDIKISQLPEVNAVAPTDIAPFVASGVTSKITVQSIANSLTTVSSSISSSYSLTASYSNNSTSASYSLSGSYSLNSSNAISASNSSTSSYSVSALSSSYALTSSFSLSSSYSSRALTSSYSETSSYANNFYVRQSITASNILVNGTITAQKLVVQTVSSSVIYSSGSNIFGDQLTDIQQFTGSVNITGSLNVQTSLAVGNISPSAIVGRIDAANDVVAFSTSDSRLKTNVAPIKDPIEKVKAISGVNFTWIEKPKIHGNSGEDVGVIAQEIEAVLPEVVTTRDSGYKAVKYEKIVPLLIEAIKELQKQIDELKALK